MRRATYLIFLCLMVGIGLFLIAITSQEPGGDSWAQQLALGGPVSDLPSAGPLARLKNSGRPLTVSYANLPLQFEANGGQTNSEVKFLSRGRGYTLFLTGNEAVLTLRSSQAKSRGKWQEAKGTREIGPRFALLAPSPRSFTPDLEPEADREQPTTDCAAVVRLKLVGANLAAKAVGLDPLPGKTNYFIGNDPKKWRTNVANYAKVRYKDIYPGVDLIYYGNQGRVEHDLVISPGADPSVIKLVVEGADGLCLDGQGNLVAQLTSGEVMLKKPTIYQPVSNPESLPPNPGKRPVVGSYLLLAGNRIGFGLGAYDRSQPLVIDPVLEYSTYLGASGDDAAEAIAVDSSGNAYVAGVTTSVDFPTTPGAHQQFFGGGNTVFVAKLNPAGSTLEYSTYLGSQANTYVQEVGAITVNSSGEAYVVGYTENAYFPTTAGAFQMSLAGESDVFVTKLNSTGSALVYSTFLGGSSLEDLAPPAIALDTSGNAYVTGETGSIDFPTTAGAYDRTCGSDGNCDPDPIYGGWRADAFVAKLDPTGSALAYSTYLGGSSSEHVPYYGRPSIVVDSSGNAIVSGNTSSQDFPTTAGALDAALDGYTDVFITKLNDSGTALLSSTFLGGSDADGTLGLTLDATGNVFVAGQTFSADFPTSQGAFDRTCGGCTNAADAFVAKLNSTASALVYSTYLGGSDGDGAAGIAVDSQGNAFVTGVTGSDDFPLASPLKPTIDASMWDIFLTKINATGTALLFSTYLGGDAIDVPAGVGLDSAANAYLTGLTTAYGATNNFPTTPGAFQTSPPGGDFNAFVAKVSTYVAGPSVSLYPTELLFGDQLLGSTSAPKTVVLTNNGDSTLNITDLTADPHFAVAATTTCPATGTVAAGATCDIDVTFSPTATGPHAGTVSVSSDAAGSPHTVALTGTGTDFSLDVQSSGSTSATVNAGQTATYNLQIEPAGFSGSAALACAFQGSTPRGARCSVSPTSVTVNGTDPAPFTVNVSTTARSMVAPQPRFTLPSDWSRHGVPLLALMLFTFFGAAVLRRRRACLVLATALVCVALWAACGGGGGGAGPAPQTGTPAGNYTLTVTGTVGSLSRQTTLTLTVN
jgi:hypothetical protein